MADWNCTIDTARFNANVRRLAPEMKRKAKAASKKRNRIFAAHLDRNVPEKSGKLASTIEVSETSSGGKIEFKTTIGNEEEEIYAVPLEFGHVLKGVHIQGKHFFFPLASLHNRRWRNDLRRAMRKVFKDFV